MGLLAGMDSEIGERRETTGGFSSGPKASSVPETELDRGKNRLESV